MKDQKPTTEPPAPPQSAETPKTSPRPPEEAQPAASVEAQTEPPPEPVLVTAYAPENWERLFVIGDDGRSVWLRFLPDTQKYRADTLVLIVYGHKVLRDVPRVRIAAAHAAVQKTVDSAPYRPTDGSFWSLALGSMQRVQAALNADYADECVPLYLERVGLSQGGFYQLTQDGERRAAALAYDLIRRA